MTFDSAGFTVCLQDQVLLLTPFGCPTLFLLNLHLGAVSSHTDPDNSASEYLRMSALLFLEALSSPGLWQENSICLGIPRFTGWSTEFRKSPWFLLGPRQLTVVWKSSKAATEPRIGLTSFVYQLLGITVLCFLLPCVLNATVLRVVCTLSNLYCFGRRETFLILYLGWKHKSSLVHI